MKGILRLILLMFVAAGALALQSCSDDRVMQIADDMPISFRIVMDRPTKATSYTQTNLQSFNVTAVKKKSHETHLDRVDFSTTDYTVWSSADEYYWPKNKEQLVFYAYAPKSTYVDENNPGNGVQRHGNSTYTVTPLADTDNQVDLVFARTTSGIKDGVSLNFRHVMSQVAIKFKNSNPNIYFHVTGWKVSGVNGTGTFYYNSSDDTGTQASTTQGVTSNTIPASYWSYQSNPTSYTKVLASGYKTVTADANSWGTLPGSSAILVPQSATTAATEYTDDDNDSSTPKVLNGSYIAIQYEAFDILTHEPIIESGTWGCWPVSFQWDPGFRYNYVIDLAGFGFKETSAGTQFTAVKEGANVQFVGVTVDSWQPDGGNEIDLPLAQMVPTTPYLRFHTEDGIQQFYVETAPDFDGYESYDYGWEIYDTYFTSEDTNLEYSVDEGVSWHQLMSSAHDISSSPQYDLYTNKISFGPNAHGDGQNIDLLVRGKKGFHCSYSWKADTLYEYHGYDVGRYYPHFGFVSKNYKVECSGAVTALTDYNNINAPFAYDYQYAELFMDNTCLISAPVIPTTSVTNGGCYSMFENTGLTELPDDMLPATSLGTHCYERMFHECQSLTTLSDNLLPAATLPDYCYRGMFSLCNKLTSLPNNLMSATTAGPYSCYSMFSQCTSLASLSGNVLPATTLDNFCYIMMFSGCSALTSLTENMLPATVLSSSCYYEMFNGCSSLTSIPSGFLPATTLANQCYYEMFYNCSSLTSVPSDLLPATTLSSQCYYYMFYNTALTSIPSGFLPATTMISSCYYGMFSSCKQLATVPENLLPATTLAHSCYYSMFNSCSKLETAPELPATTLADYCYNSMFYSCSKLENAPALPATTLKQNCYSSMFRECTSLVTAPDLPALSLSYQAYNYMFFGCTGLRYVKALFTSLYGNGSSSYNSGVSNWLGGTTNTSECVFVKNSAAVWTVGGSTSNINPPYIGIPSNWTMQTVTP